ncbi:hypothetical protein [Bacillus safensis]|uniref:hypothetical protein n=1 Tax=Bacillus safensis TaxID=561879 RepID=UPI00148EC12C|nr:hypothetical protein [Bacillus safensis]NOL36741.1 hypothetical protein [Bacillus safensis]
MLKISIYEDGRIEKEEVERSDYEGWMRNKSIGRLFRYSPKGECEIILLDGERKKYYFNRIVKSKIRDIDKEVKELHKRRADLLKLSQIL